MDIIDERRAVIQPLNKFWYQNKVSRLDMLRLDLLHPVVSGNKWYKLRLNMKHAMESGYKTIVTAGGGYSNHLLATAYAVNMFGLKSVGVVRGKYETLTPTLQACRDAGMELIFVTKEDYKNRHEPEWALNLVNHFDEVFFIPEGGANEWGRAGAGLIDRFIGSNYSHIVVAVGSATTMLGIRNKISNDQAVIGMAPMKEGAYLEKHINEHLAPGKDNWQLYDHWHFGGFGKWTPALLAFMNDFYNVNKVPLDIVYTSKMMYGVRELLFDNFFNVGDEILCIHSGGLQGNISVSGQLVY